MSTQLLRVLERSSQKVIGLLMIVVSLYLLIRAYVIPFTIDESITYFQFVSQGVWLPNSETWNANNHILNTLLTILTERIFGSSELALRLPNLLAGIIFILYARIWSKQVNDRLMALTMFVGLVCGQFVLDFFGLCRGYGLSLAFLLACWYHLSSWWKDQGRIDLIMALMFGTLAVAANLSTMVPALISIALTILGVGLQNDFSVRKRINEFALILLFGVVPMTGLAFSAFRLKDGGHLYYGGGEGFWEVTVRSLIEATYAPWEDIISYLFPVGLSITLVCAFYAWVHSRQAFWKTNLFVIFVLLMGSVLGQILLNLFFEVNFPQDRVGLFYVPLLILTTTLTREHNLDVSVRRILTVPIMLIWVLPLNTLFTANITHARMWTWDAGAKQFFEQLMQVNNSGGQVPVVAGSTLQTYSYDYYNMINGRPLCSMQDHISGSEIPDYQYSFPEGSGSWWQFDTVCVNTVASRYLLERNPTKERQTILSSSLGSIQTSDEFINMLSLSLDSLPNTDLNFKFSFNIKVDKLPLKAWVVLDVVDSSGVNVMYRSIALERLSRTLEWSQGDLKDAIVYPGSFMTGAEAKLYLWNIEKIHIELKDPIIDVVRLM